VHGTAGIPAPGIGTLWSLVEINRTILGNRQTHGPTEPQRDAHENSTHSNRERIIIISMYISNRSADLNFRGGIQIMFY